MAIMRAKVKITGILRHTEAETLQMHPVCAKSYPSDGSDENNTYAKFTPSGNFQLTIANPALIGKFKVDQLYYVDFTLAE